MTSCRPRGSWIDHRTVGSSRWQPSSRLCPMEIRPNICASLSAGLADELQLDIGQPNIISPSVAADRGRTAAVVVRAIDQQAPHAGGSHLSEGDLLVGEGGHRERMEPDGGVGKPLRIEGWPWDRRKATGEGGFALDQCLDQCCDESATIEVISVATWTSRRSD